jgi:hypothetical protein
MEPKQLVIEFLSNVAAALILAVIFAKCPVSKGMAALIGLAVGLYGWISIEVSYWNWYHFPADFEFAALVEQAVGGLLSGLAVALVLGKKRPAPVI